MGVNIGACIARGEPLVFDRFFGNLGGPTCEFPPNSHGKSTRKAMSTPNIVSLNGLELYGLDVKDPGLCVDLATAAEPDPHGTERKESPNTAAVFEVDTSLIALCPPLPVVASSSGSGGSSRRGAADYSSAATAATGQRRTRRLRTLLNRCLRRLRVRLRLCVSRLRLRL